MTLFTLAVVTHNKTSLKVVEKDVIGVIAPSVFSSYITGYLVERQEAHKWHQNMAKFYYGKNIQHMFTSINPC